MKSPLALVAALSLLSGCSARAPEAPPRVAPLASERAPVAAVEPSGPASVADYQYTYIPSLKRDPFRPDGSGPVPACCEVQCDAPLCRYSLDELKLTGVVSGMARPVAMLESPTGKGYPVYAGTRVGKRGGVVKKVLRDSIVVAELWPDPMGQAKPYEVVLRVPSDEPLVLDE
jgi:type IV pilus assembly protein PilP